MDLTSVVPNYVYCCICSNRLQSWLFLRRCRLFFRNSAEILLDKNAAWADPDKNIQIEYKVDEVGIGKPIDIPAGSSSCQFIDNQDREVFSHPLITSYVW